jgi:hypothetical protein
MAQTSSVQACERQSGGVAAAWAETRATVRTAQGHGFWNKRARLPLVAGRLLFLGLPQPARDGVQSEDQGSERDADEELGIGHWVLPELIEADQAGERGSDSKD